MTHQASAAIDDNARKPGLQPIHYWGFAGAVSVMLQVYIYGSWIFSEGFRPTDPGPDPLPDVSRIGLLVFQILSVATGIGALIWMVRSFIRSRHFTSFQLMMTAWLLTYWQDPWLNFLRPNFTYNAHMFNYGAWCEFIPGWLAPNGSLIPEPLLINIPAYFFDMPGAVMLGVLSMRALLKVSPRLNGLGLYFAALPGIIAWDLPMEILSTRIIHYDGWLGGFQALSLWGGLYYQLPIYELVLFPSALAGCAVLMYRADAKGYTAVERGAGSIKAGWRRELLRVLAVAAFVNLLNGAYTTGFGVLSLYTDRWPVDVPSWLRDQQCGAGTRYQCPGRDVPMATRYSPPV